MQISLQLSYIMVVLIILIHSLFKTIHRICFPNLQIAEKITKLKLQITIKV